jgi:hypothetical protein
MMDKATSNGAGDHPAHLIPDTLDLI